MRRKCCAREIRPAADGKNTANPVACGRRPRLTDGLRIRDATPELLVRPPHFFRFSVPAISSTTFPFASRLAMSQVNTSASPSCPPCCWGHPRAHGGRSRLLDSFGDVDRLTRQRHGGEGTVVAGGRGNTRRRVEGDKAHPEWLLYRVRGGGSPVGLFSTGPSPIKPSGRRRSGVERPRS